MLKKVWRLKTDEDFGRVFRKGTPLFFGSIGCKMAKNSLGHVRIGFSLSKKHLGDAVLRNRVRRVISGSFLPFLKKIECLPFDVVFFTAKRVERQDIKTFASIGESVVKYNE